MSFGMNRVELIGRLGADVRQSFRLAVCRTLGWISLRIAA